MGDTINYKYKIEIVKVSEEDGGGYLANVPSLPGCMSDGDTAEEALKNVNDAIKCWIETAQELGREIPKPDEYRVDDEYSGKLLLRLPKYLHKMVAERAIRENSSINQLIQSYISMGLGYEIGKNQISINVEYKNDRIPKNINESILSLWKPMLKNKRTEFLTGNIRELLEKETLISLDR